MTTKQRTQLIDDLKDLRKLLKKGWCKGAFAKTKRGAFTNSCAPDAAKWCLVGGMCKVVEGNPFHRQYWNLKTAISTAIPSKYPCIATFNDKQPSVKPVLALITKALRQVKKAA